MKGKAPVEDVEEMLAGEKLFCVFEEIWLFNILEYRGLQVAASSDSTLRTDPVIVYKGQLRKQKSK